MGSFVTPQAPSSVHHSAAKETVMDEQLCLFTAQDVRDLSDWEEMAEQGVACVPPPKVIAQFVRWSRQVLQWEKKVLAGFAGVSLSTVERIERGEQVSAASLDRVAAVLKQSRGAFTKPRVPLGLKATLDKIEEHHKQLEEMKPVTVRPLTTQPQVAELVRTDMHVVDGSRLGGTLKGKIAALCEWLDFGSCMIGSEEDPLFDLGRRERVRRRWIYRMILDRVREVERQSMGIALAGVYEAETNIKTLPKVRVALVSFFPRASDPAAFKRAFLLARARIDVLAVLRAEEDYFQPDA